MPVALDPDTGVDVATDAVARALKAGADAAGVQHGYSELFEVNFDTNDVTLVRSTVGDTLAITVYDDTRQGSTKLTGRAHDAVDRAVAQAVEAARAGEPDPANVLPDAQVEPGVSDGDQEPDRDAMVDTVLRHIAWTKENHPLLRSDSSVYLFQSTWVSYANSHGRTQHARRGRYVTSAMVTGKDDTRATSFNYVGHIDTAPIDDLFALPSIQRLIDSTLASFDAKAIPSTFVGDVIFTPEALGTIVETVGGALGGVALMRKATPYIDKLGASIAASGFTLAHRPTALAGAAPFDSHGFVNRELPVITDGVLENFLIDWYFSNKLGMTMTTGCTDYVVAPGDTPLDEIIARTERGILLGRYSGGQPNQNLDFSGVAKNSFYVENGKVTHPISETMIAGNFVSVLESITAISQESINFGDASYPWVATTGVTVSTK
jgi:PmbA protein